MLEILNTLQPFIEDCYRKINVREYSRLMRISPPTASRNLDKYYKEGLLSKETDRGYIFYNADRDNSIFISLSMVFWRSKLKESGLLDYLERSLIHPIIILYGSLSKAETTATSDIDLAILTPSKKELDVSRFERKLKRDIQLFVYTKREEVTNKELLNNILNGEILVGGWL